MGSNDKPVEVDSSIELRRILETLTSSDMVGALSNIANLGEMLELSRDGYSPEEAGILIKLQAQRIATQIDSMIIAEKVQTGELKLHPHPTTLRPTLEEVIGTLQPMSDRYATKFRLGSSRKLKPILVDSTILAPVLRSTFEGVIRTTISKRIHVYTVSREERLFLHITDKDASFESTEDGETRTRAGGSHAIAIPSFYVAKLLLNAMDGDMRINANQKRRHIDLIFPHSIQLNLGLK